MNQFTEFWGAYCSQCNVWLLRTNGDPFYYPAPEIMRAMLDVDGNTWHHLWEVTKFGNQESIEVSELPMGSALCPNQIRKLDKSIQSQAMTISDSKSGVAVSSWGWLDNDGQPISRDRARFRLWSIRTNSLPNRAGFIALPVETDDWQVLLAACKMFREQGEE